MWRTCPSAQAIHVLLQVLIRNVHLLQHQTSPEESPCLRRGPFYPSDDLKTKNPPRATPLISSRYLFSHAESQFIREKKERKKKKKKLALAPCLVRRAVFESRSPTDSRAAPKSLCYSYCLCCCEYFIGIFQYLFIFVAHVDVSHAPLYRTF